MFVPRPSIVARRMEFTNTGPITGTPQATAPSILNRSFNITADVEIPKACGDGMLTTASGRFAGWAFYVLKMRPVFVYDLMDFSREWVESKAALSPGKHKVVFDFTYDGLGFGKSGTGLISVDGV